MAELVPIKSFASPKGSNSGQAKPGPDSQPAIVARFAAINYARKLTEAPDGSRITSTEKNVLLHIALAFNSDLGVAWPAEKTLAKDACISERHCQRTVVSLEQKGIIQRVPMRRSDLGGQSSNDYFFPTLGSPPQTPEAKARRLEIQRVSRTPMTPMTGRRGQTRPTAADTSVRPARTNATGEPGHGRPPIESLGKSLGDCFMDLEEEAPADLRGKGCHRDPLSARSSAPVVRNRAANLQQSQSRKTYPDKSAPFANSDIARMAWNSAMEELRSAHGAKEFKKFRFRDAVVVSAGEDSAGIVHLTLRSPAPEKAKMGIAKHEIVISRALRGFYGLTVQLRVIGNEPASAPPDQPSKSE